jgi:hypothetical protein
MQLLHCSNILNNIRNNSLTDIPSSSRMDKDMDNHNRDMDIRRHNRKSCEWQNHVISKGQI